ncbi:hypothetical protein ACHAPJ_002075 [Fusarium lateritium]
MVHHPLTNSSSTPIQETWSTYDISTEWREILIQCLVGAMVCAGFVAAVFLFVYVMRKTEENCLCRYDGTKDDIENGGHNGSAHNGHPESYPMTDIPTGPRPSGYTTNSPMGYTPSNPQAACTPTSSPSGDSFDLSTADYASGKRPERYTTRPRSSGNGFGLSVPEYMSRTLPPSDIGQDCAPVHGWTPV